MMHEKFLKKLQQKGKKLDPLEQKAKMDVVGELSRQASDMLGSKVHPLKKVTVASDSKEGLKAGLDKAAGIVDHVGNNVHEHDPEKLVEGAEEELHADLDKDNEEGESHDHLAKVLGEGSPEEEASESPEMEAKEDIEAEHADHSPEELDAKIQHLLALKHKKLSGQA